jgi:tellurite resistance protein
MTNARRATAATRRTGQRGVRERATARAAVPRLNLDEAFLALLIGAMHANQHMSREEAARAHHIVWSMKRFRRKSGETVGRLLDATRTLVEQHGASAVVTEAARVIPPRFRSAAFALSADLILADGKIERAERQFLDRLAGQLGLDRATRDAVLNTMRIKNSA